MTQRHLFSVLGILMLGMLSFSHGQDLNKAVINDPDGFTNVRSGQSSDSAIVAKVKTGEVFEFEGAEGSEWWKVKLSSGKTGWMHHSRIKGYYTLADLPAKGEPTDELVSYGKGHGIDYYALAISAAKGEPKGLQKFFAIDDMDGAAGEGHAQYLNTVIHVAGDDTLSAFLTKQPLVYQLHFRNSVVSDFVLWPFDSFTYLQRHFPKTAAIIFRKQLTDWVSPDGKYAIRKTFSDALSRENTKVTRAELIEKASGKLIADLTNDDQSEGSNREGKVLWSPDSRRFAYLSSGANDHSTVVFQLDKDKAKRIELPVDDLPGRDNDAELKGAKHIYVHIDPVKWEKADVLTITRHDYFEGHHPDRSINSIGRFYTITIRFEGDQVLADEVVAEKLD